MKKHIVVTGARNYLGSRLIKYLYDNTDLNIIGIDIDIFENSYRYKLPKSERIRLFSSDFKSDNHSNVYEYILENFSISDLIYLDRISSKIDSVTLIEKVVNSNLKFAIDTINFCASNNIRLIYCASPSKFTTDGEDNIGMINSSPYYFCNSVVIDYLRNYRKWNSRLNYCIDFIYEVYGDNLDLGGLAGDIIGELYDAHEFSQIVDIPKTASRDFIHIDDVVEGVYKSITKGKKYSEYHLGTGTDHYVAEIANLMSVKYEINNKLDYKSRAPIDNPATTELNWKPSTNIINYLQR